MQLRYLRVVVAVNDDTDVIWPLLQNENMA